MNIWEINRVSPMSLKELFIQWAFPKQGEFFNKVWDASFSIIAWSIWKECHARIFSNFVSSLSQIQELILLRMSWWIKGWDDLFPTSLMIL